MRPLKKIDKVKIFIFGLFSIVSFFAEKKLIVFAQFFCPFFYLKVTSRYFQHFQVPSDLNMADIHHTRTEQQQPDEPYLLRVGLRAREREREREKEKERERR